MIRWPMVLLLATLAVIVLTSRMNIFPDYWDLDEVQPQERQRDRQLIRDVVVLACVAVLGGLLLRAGVWTWKTAAALLILLLAAAGTVLERISPGTQVAGQAVRSAPYLLGLLALPAAARLGPGLDVADLTPKGMLTG